MGRPLKYTGEEREAYLASRKQDRHKPRTGDRHRDDYQRPTVRTGDRHREGYQAPKRLDKFSRSAFIAWDGEALDIIRPSGEQQYIYACLLNNAGDIAPVPGRPRPYGLGTVECLELLLKGARTHPDHTHVIYSGNLDVNKILRDVPRKVLARLNTGKFTTWTVSSKLAYGLLWHPRHEFFVGRFVADKDQRWKTITKADGTTERKPNFTDKIQLWDVWTFFQCSFLRALRDNLSPEELKELDYETIVAGKERRADFTMNELHETIIPYCRLETRALVALMEKLRMDIQAMNKHLGLDIKLRRWDGSGAMTGALMQRFGMRNLIEVARDITPPEVEQAGLHAYGGGRFETPQYGHYDGPVWAYDINSAFPSVMVDMPDLSQGEWTHAINQEPHIFTQGPFAIHETPDLFKNAQPFSLFKISWRFPDHKQPFYPFFVRGDDMGIDYSMAGLNWVWYPEILAASETIPNFWNWVYIHEVWQFVPATDNRPFAWQADLYSYRRMLKAQGNGFATTLKYGGLTGPYGKTAQKLGYDEETGRLPTYHNILYAGFTTAGIRAKVWRAMMQEPKLIVDIAADGIKSLVPLNLPISSELGEWSFTQLSGLTMVQSGVYWTHERSETPVVDENGQPDPCPLHGDYCASGVSSKGLDPNELDEQVILDAWRKALRELKIPARCFMGLGTSVSPVKEDGSLLWDAETIEQRWDAWGTWNTDPRTLKLTARGTKRIERRTDKDGYPIHGKKNPSRALIDTYARSNPLLQPVEDYAGVFPYPDEVISRKHEVPWDMEPVGKANVTEEQQLDYEVGLEMDAQYEEVLNA